MKPFKQKIHAQSGWSVCTWECSLSIICHLCGLSVTENASNSTISLVARNMSKTSFTKKKVLYCGSLFAFYILHIHIHIFLSFILYCESLEQCVYNFKMFLIQAREILPDLLLSCALFVYWLKLKFFPCNAWMTVKCGKYQVK